MGCYITTKYVYADKDSEDNHDPSAKYSLDPHTWEQFAKSQQKPNWQVWRNLFLHKILFR